MTIDKNTVEELSRLYGRRQDLQTAKEYAMDKGFWGGVTRDAFGGSGTRSMVLNAVGGAGAFEGLLSRAISARIEEIQREIDIAIMDLGGEP